MRHFGWSAALWMWAASVALPAEAQASRCDIPREARDIWRCEKGLVIGPDNVIIRLPVPETDPEALYQAGLQAAQREDWRVALAYFTAAHQRAHLVPRYMYNLGLAHARAGHDIPAIAWFTAYLIAEPDAPNRAAVWTLISQSEARVRTAIDRVWGAAEDAAAAMPVEQEARWRAYYSLAGSAAQAADITRARAFQNRANQFAGPDLQQPVDGFLRGYNVYMLSAALDAGDPAIADLIRDYGPVDPTFRGEERRELAAGTFRHRLGGPYAPAFMKGRLEFIGPDPDGWMAARGIDAPAMRSAIAARPDTDAIFHLTVMAALGDPAEALDGVSRLTSDGFLGNYRQMTAMAVGQALLLRGDRSNARRALALANRFVQAGSQGIEAAQLESLIAAEDGDAERAILMLEIKSFRIADPRAIEPVWREWRYDATGLVAEYLRNRGRAEEAVALAARMDSFRRVAFLETLNGVDAQAALLAAAGQLPISPERRRAIENAVVTALQLNGASYELAPWLASIQADRNAERQSLNLGLAASRMANALRRIRADYQRIGGTWGE